MFDLGYDLGVLDSGLKLNSLIEFIKQYRFASMKVKSNNGTGLISQFFSLACKHRIPLLCHHYLFKFLHFNY